MDTARQPALRRRVLRPCRWQDARRHRQPQRDDRRARPLHERAVRRPPQPVRQRRPGQHRPVGTRHRAERLHDGRHRRLQDRRRPAPRPGRHDRSDRRDAPRSTPTGRPTAIRRCASAGRSTATSAASASPRTARTSSSTPPAAACPAPCATRPPGSRPTRPAPMCSRPGSMRPAATRCGASTITDDAVFIGGHNRWNNNPLGSDRALPGAVPRPGMAALDPVSGRPLRLEPRPQAVGPRRLRAAGDAGGPVDGLRQQLHRQLQVQAAEDRLLPLRRWPDRGLDRRPAPCPARSTSAAASRGATNVLYRVDAGGPAIQSQDSGPDWSADTDADNPLRNSGSNTAGYSPVANVDSTVPAGTPSAIFDTERWGPNDGNEMQWNFPVPAGTPGAGPALLRQPLHGHQRSRTAGLRRRRQRPAVLDHYDIVADAGDQTGTMKSIDLTVAGQRQRQHHLHHEVENPLINGIEIVRTDVTPPPQPRRRT